MSEQDSRSGYTLEKVHTVEQVYQLVSDDELGEEREYVTGWDWRTVSENAFQVFLSLEVRGTKQINELVRVQMVGTFAITQGEQTLNLPQFVQYAGPAILFAYIRQIVTTLTANGPFEPHLIAPINMQKAMEFGEFEETTGYRQLKDDPELAESLGVDL